jgi:FtsH-binding integral membrane protein
MFEEKNNVVREYGSTGIELYVTKVFGWMFLGLIVTAMAAFWVISSNTASIFLNPMTLIVLSLVEIGLVIYLTRNVANLSSTAGKTLFILYSAVNGLTLSYIFYMYNLGTIYTAFGATALTFGAFALYGYMTKTDLTSFGKIAMFALIGIIISTIVNIFVRSSGFDLIISYIGVIIFSGLTAFDTQKIKEYYYSTNGDLELQDKISIIGALALYLDFINLFLFILRILGRGRD